MKKIFIGSVGMFCGSFLLLFGLTSWVTRITFVNFFNEFEVILLLLGFSTVNTLIYFYSQIIMKKISSLKESSDEK